MTEREVLKLALEALQKIYIAPEHEEYIRVWWPACEQAIPAIKEALAQPEEDYKRGYADAMNWKVQNHLEHFPPKGTEQAPMNYYRADAEGNLERTDIHFAQPKQDWIERERAVGYREGHRAALSQRTWVGLTDEEIWELMCRNVLETDLCRAVEAKLKEKNT